MLCGMACEVIALDTPTLGDRSYLVHDGTTAAVIDPQRDIDRVIALTEGLGIAIEAVVETHIHNDYVSGGHALARAQGAKYLVSAEDPVGFTRQPVRDGEVIPIGSFALRVRRTPGHTFTHLAYVLLNGAAEALGVFTGGSLLHGSTGRPDLLGPDHAATLAGLQHDSARALAEELPEATPIYPTHGFGSFCAATATSGEASTIGDERRLNPALLDERAAFIAATLAGLDSFPSYYRHMGPANLSGPPPADLTALPELSIGEIRAALARGEWVVDVRPRTEWAAGHAPGTLSFGVDGSLATYLGWVFPYGEPLVLVGGRPEEIASAQRELIRIGIDRPLGRGDSRLIAATDEHTTSRVTFAAVVEALSDATVVVLDVRRNGERAASHIAGTLHIPFHELLARLAEIPPASTVWVHCAGAYRAAAACSMLERAGYRTVLVDEDYEACRSVKGLTIVTSDAAPGPSAPSDVGAAGSPGSTAGGSAA